MMHEHEQFLLEKRTVDQLLKNSSRIIKVEENLNGALIRFKDSNQERIGTIRLLTPEGRIYFTNQLLLRKTGESVGS